MRQVCQTCKSDQVARCKWVNVNDDTIYNEDSGTSLEWCMNCRSETAIVEEECSVKPNSHCTIYQEDTLLHVIKTGHKDEYFLLEENAYQDQHHGKTRIMNVNQLLNTYPQVVLHS